MELLIYKASAGSGKTFTLAVEYIKHLILNPKAYRQILAVTFTNKATGEMKERILQQLNGIRLKDPDSDVYLHKIQEDLLKLPGGSKWTEEKIREKADEALHNMLHDYNRFRVETIDSFFQSVMRNLARELDLSPNLNIELNNAEVLDKAVDSMIEKLTPDSPVLSWLLEYINERIQDDKKWNISNEIKSFGNHIFNETYIEKGDKLRFTLQDHDIIRLYRETMRSFESKALKEMEGFADDFEKTLNAHGYGEEDLSGKSKGICSYFRKLKRGELSDKETLNVTLKKHLDSAENWVSKTNKDRNSMMPMVQRELLPLLERAETARKKNKHIVNSSRLSLQHLNKLQLLNHIDEEVRTLNHEQNRFLLSDTNALLHRLVGEGDSSFVFEKIGANIQNIMIDEFQDTSRMQWGNFRMLLLEGLSQGADSLIVGDVKQSIYRWRNGDWGILNNLGQEASKELPYPIRVETLKVNRRSESNIISFNNSLFTHLVEILNDKHLDELNEECSTLKNAYADVVQESPKKEAKGYVKVEFLKGNEEYSYPELTLKVLGETIQDLISKGVQENDIAILVRKKKYISAIGEYLSKELGLQMVSDEAFRLDASLAVCMLIDALRVLSNSDDCIAQAALTKNYQEYIVGNKQLAPFTIVSKDLLPPDFFDKREELTLMPLYDLMEELFRMFQLKLLKDQDAYLFSFFDAVNEYLQDNSSDIATFLNYWDEKLCSKTIASGEMNGIRAYSIHKSKGLQFHTVLLPFCDWKTENETNDQLVWCTPDEEPYNAIHLVPVNYSATMADSVYRKDYLEERLQLWVDNLNILYVALTRAEKNLLIWGREGQKNTISELISTALPPMAQTLEATLDEQTFEYGALLPSKETSQTAPAATPNRFSEEAAKLPLHLNSIAPHVEFRQSNRSADFMAGLSEEESAHQFINRGTMLHTLFAQIETLKDIDTAIDQLIFEGVLNREMETEVRELTEKAFSSPQIAQWYDGSWQLFSECEIIWIENGQLCKRRPDRVMMKGNEIVVVDFKFGKPNKHYNSQVKEYMKLLKSMGYAQAKISGYLWYVESETIEKV